MAALSNPRLSCTLPLTFPPHTLPPHSSFSIIAVPATLVGWNFSNEYSNHIARVKEREKASKRLAKSGLLGKSFAGKSFAQPQEDIRGYVKEAVEEATAGLRAEIKALLVKLEGKK